MPRKAGAASSKLTVKQETFCRAYIKTGNASEAYRRAYDAKRMKDAAVHVKACELLKNGKVAVRIETLQSEIAKRHDISVDKIISELAKIGFSDVRRLIRWGDSVALEDPASGELRAVHGIAIKSSEEIDDATAGAIAEVSQTREGIKVKMYDKKAALVDLGKHLGMFAADNAQKGEAAGKAIGEAMASSRDVARAVLDILREAKIETGSNDAA
jgi:Phage terminase, small subunit